MKAQGKLKPVRVAAVQLAIGADVDENLAATLAAIDRVAEIAPDLIVLPEFVNHASWYQSPAHCHEVSLALDGPFLEAIATRARTLRAFISVNATVRLDGTKTSGSNLLFDRSGRLVGRADKQILMGHENDVLTPAVEPSRVVETDIGRIGLYSCMDGVVFETPRGLALRGAQILTNSLNSFAFDEGSLHIPVRAAENKVFVVAANKVGSLVPDPEAVAQMTGIPAHFLAGSGESQIVAPDGTVLARASTVQAGYVYADIDPTEADDKHRPSGTDVFASRRPEIYGALIEAAPAMTSPESAEKVWVATFQGPDGRSALDAVTQAINHAADAGARCLVLPELYGIGPSVKDAGEAVARADALVAQLTALAAARGVYVATSVARRSGTGIEHAGVLLGPKGLELTQGQLHRSERHASWANVRADVLRTVDLPFGRVALIVGEDAIYPETFRLAALAGATTVLALFHAEERWETELGLLERAAENRLCLVASTRPTVAGTSLIATLEDDFTLMTAWKTRTFDAIINRPIVARATPSEGLLAAEIHPARAHNKVLSHRTHLLEDRPWKLAAALTAPALRR